MTEGPQAPAGWYPQEDGSQRYWDGMAWTDHTAPAAAPVDAAAAETKRKDTRRGYIAIAVLVAIGVGIFWISTRPRSVPNFGIDNSSSTAHVIYKVHGSAATVSYTAQTPTGTSQGDADVPLTNKAGGEGLQFTFRQGAFLYISAQNNGESGTVECIIEVDGIVVSRNESSGAYQIATCQGSA